jgi:tetraprenyl-beta-curcumene synthase
MTIHRPAPLSISQLSALGAGAARELGWGLGSVRTELDGWRTRASAIPDPSLRSDALRAQAEKRVLVDGAALFWTLPRRRQPELLRLLVAFQTLANLIDHTSERAARGDGAERASSILLLLDAVDIDRPLVGYDAEPPVADGGYVHALVQACRAGCATLPHYRAVREMLLREVNRARSFDIEHDPDEGRRAERMKQFADCEFGDTTDGMWWELTAGASSLLTAIVLLALATDEQMTKHDLRRAVDAYAWAARVSALLDNYIDQFDDATSGAHNYLAYYPATEVAVHRMSVLVDRTLREVGALRNGERHLVIVASMIAMFLSSDSARSRSLRGSTRALAAHGGALTRLLMPILRAWRVAYGQRAT